MPTLRVFALVTSLLCFAVVANARSLVFSFTDPQGDQQGRIDVTSMTVTFDDTTGDFAIILRADAEHPFAGQFRVNINLFNPDAMLPGNDRSTVSITLKDYNLVTPTNTLQLTGTVPNLQGWGLGNRVAASSPPFGNPPGTSLFRSAVEDLPVKSCAFIPDSDSGCPEDNIAWGKSTTIANGLTAVSSASYLPTVAPDSFLALFGTGLADGIVSGASDDAGQLPAELGDITVQIDGQPAGLSYVSPGQINCVVPRVTDAGAVPVSVMKGGVEVAFGIVFVSLTAPGLFSMDGTGKGAAAALNAVTFTREPFSVLTKENFGSDKRTRLALYGTGIRYAGNAARNPSITNAAANVHVNRADPAGGPATIAVEYAGPAPGYPGLDQVNIVLPNEANTVERLNLAVEISGVVSNTLSVGIQQGAMPPPVLEVSPQDGYTAAGQYNSLASGQSPKIYTVTNVSTARQDYTAGSDAAWLSISPPAGSLAPNASANVTVSLSSASNSLAAGNYSGTITFASGTTRITRSALLAVAPAGACVNLAGTWNATETGTLTETVTVLGETDGDTATVQGSGTINIIQDGCSIRYIPPAVAGLITPQQAALLQRTGTVDGINVTIHGQLTLVDLTMPGFVLTQISENQMQGSGQVSGGVLTLKSTGRFSGSGTVTDNGVSAPFSVVVDATTTLTARRSEGIPAVVSLDTGNARSRGLLDGLKRKLEPRLR